MASGLGRSHKERIQKDLNKDCSSYEYCSPPGRTTKSAGLAEMKPGILPFRNFRESTGFPTALSLGGGETLPARVGSGVLRRISLLGVCHQANIHAAVLGSGGLCVIWRRRLVLGQAHYLNPVYPH